MKAKARPAPRRIRIGCAGWQIPGQHAHLFGEGDSVLSRYATVFDVAEINSSFYRPHQTKTYQRWAGAVPRTFAFSVKLPKQITHEHRLQACGPALDAFCAQVAGLGSKLAGVLVQLPPSLQFDARVAQTFFAMLGRRLDANIACEPRHASWFCAAADALLARHDVARVAADPAPCPGASEPGANGNWRYWRWHGFPRMYYSAYDDDSLQRLAGLLAQAATGSTAKTQWVMFDNTAHGHAVADAARLKRLLSGP